MALAPEDRLTSWLRRRVASHGADLLGDDAAFLPGTRTAVTVDQQLEGVHFPKGLAPEVIGRRLVAVNLSDVAAIGGRPTFGFLTVAAPSRFPTRRLLAAVESALVRHGAQLAGGDLAGSSALSTGLTLVAERVPRGRWLRRAAARAGDHLWLSGTVGDSALGRLLLAGGARFERGQVRLAPAQQAAAGVAAAARRAVRRHLMPEAQLEIGEWLARRRRAAAIDLSDGLLIDLERLCRASRVGAVIDAARLPSSDHFQECAALIGADPAKLALAGGEDYVLLFALPKGVRLPADFGATDVGTVRRGSRVEVVGATTPTRGGWDHFIGER